MRSARSLILAFLALVMLISSVVRVYSHPLWQSGSQGPQPLAYGQTVNGELSPQRPEVLYIFAAQQGDAITVAMDAGAASFDPLIILVDESQQGVVAVGNVSTSGTGTPVSPGTKGPARLRFVIPASANYILRATAVQGSGDIRGAYTLTLALDNPTPTPAPSLNAPILAALQPGEDITGDLSDSVRFHLYAFRAKQGDPVSAQLELSENVQAGLYLYAADFREIARAELGQSLSARTPADGLYFLMVARAAASGAGTFKLRQVNASSTTAIGPGKTVRGSITADSAVKTYSMQGTQGQMIIARMRRLSGNLAVYLYVVAIDNGQTIAQATDENGVAELSTVLPANGTYAVVATREGKQNGNTTGDYSLVVSPPGQSAPIPPAFQGFTPIKYGDKVSGEIDDKTFAAPYVFSAEAGDSIQATMSAASGSTLDAYLILQNANGDTIAEDDNGAGGSNARLQVTLPKEGYYALVATRAQFAKGKSVGKFDLSLSVVSPEQGATGGAANGLTLVAGQSQTGQIGAHVGTLFRFEAQANTSINLDANPSNGLGVFTVLADSNLKQLAVSAGGPIRNVLLANAGTYYVFVIRRGGPNEPAVGTFTLSLQGTINPVPTAPPGTLNFGQPVTGSITSDVYQVRYTIECKRGTTLVISLEAASGSTLDPMVALLDANNNLLVVNDDASKNTKNAALIYDIPSDGKYVVLATRSQEAAGTTSGAFVLKVDERKTAVPTMAPPEVIPIRYGASVTGEITSQRYLFYYTFQGKTGDLISIQMNHVPGTKLDPLIYLYAYTAQPTLLAANNDIAPGNVDAAIIHFRLPQTGPYLIIASRAGAVQGTTTGSFILSLNRDE